MTAAEILRNAKELLIRDGWCQKLLVSPDGEHCMLGAINSFYRCHEHVYRAYQCLRISIGGEHDCPSVLANWNDTPGRTVDEVLAKFDEAIALAEKEAP
jgi:hypothetical protein